MNSKYMPEARQEPNFVILTFLFETNQQKLHNSINIYVFLKYIKKRGMYNEKKNGPVAQLNI